MTTDETIEEFNRVSAENEASESAKAARKKERDEKKAQRDVLINIKKEKDIEKEQQAQRRTLDGQKAVKRKRGWPKKTVAETSSNAESVQHQIIIM